LKTGIKGRWEVIPFPYQKRERERGVEETETWPRDEKKI